MDHEDIGSMPFESKTKIFMFGN